MKQVLATKWAKTFDLVDLKYDADKLDIDKLKKYQSIETIWTLK